MQRRSCRSEGGAAGAATGYEPLSARFGYAAAAALLAIRVRL